MMPDISNVNAPSLLSKSLNTIVMVLSVIEQFKSLRFDVPVQFIVATSAGAPTSSGSVKLN